MGRLFWKLRAVPCRDAPPNSLGVSIPEDERIDVAALDRAMAGKPVTERMQLKGMLYHLKLIPA